MQSDTVVGIVGAVVLVAVMVGVFAYEYNNVDDAGGDGDDTMASFNETYPMLAASGDLDGDGTPNHLDDDLDGDGLDNGNDTEIKFTHDITGSVGAANPVTGRPSQSFTFDAETGVMHVQLALTGGTATNGNVVLALQVQLTTPAGDTFTAPAQADGNSVSYTLSLDSDVGAGTYTVTVTAPQASPQAISFSGSLDFHYA